MAPIQRFVGSFEGKVSWAPSWHFHTSEGHQTILFKIYIVQYQRWLSRHCLKSSRICFIRVKLAGVIIYRFRSAPDMWPRKENKFELSGAHLKCAGDLQIAEIYGGSFVCDHNISRMSGQKMVPAHFKHPICLMRVRNPINVIPHNRQKVFITFFLLTVL